MICMSGEPSSPCWIATINVPIEKNIKPTSPIWIKLNFVLLKVTVFREARALSARIHTAMIITAQGSDALNPIADFR